MDKELNDHAGAETDDDSTVELVEEQLIEEISIDGMCGVY